MHEMDIDWVVVTQLEHVQYLAGHRFHWTFQPLAALSADGMLVLVAPEQRVPDKHAADEVHTYAARWHSTLRNDQRMEAIQVWTRAFAGQLPCRLGVEFSYGSRHLPTSCAYVDIEPALWSLRRRKDASELALLQRAMTATERMYERARAIVRPGLNELDLFNELQAVAVRELGEPLTATGNDYQSGSRGGPPRNRAVQAGELYILDLGPAYRGYFADNARTLAVSEPTAVQCEAWRHVVDVFSMIEADVRPDVSARQLFQRVQARLDRCPHGVFNHHLGHGIGLFPHEAPHLNPFWDDRFQTDDVFTVEPGLYGPDLCHGLRLENNYRVTESGVERLTNFPLELKL
jgi:Xaa-Pro aminopeptidase